MSEAFDADVLVVGAGPVGLTLAIELARRGVRVQLVQRNDALRMGRGTSVETNALEATMRASGAPFEVVDIPDDDLRRVYERDLILPRPDLHVVWRGDQQPADPRKVAAVATGRN